MRERDADVASIATTALIKPEHCAHVGRVMRSADDVCHQLFDAKRVAISVLYPPPLTVYLMSGGSSLPKNLRHSRDTVEAG